MAEVTTTLSQRHAASWVAHIPQESERIRCWAAVVAMDVVGSVTLTHVYGSAATERWRELLKFVEEVVERFGGILPEIQGDAFRAVFPVLDDHAHERRAMVCKNALLSMIDIQSNLAARQLEAPILELRGGLHAGEVSYCPGHVFGDTVHIACRLESLAAAGGLLLSDTVESLIGSQTIGLIENIGRVQLKGFEAGTRVFSAIKRPEWLIDPFGRPSIAVLPFQRLGSQETDYFGDGIADELINALAAVPELCVVSRSSTIEFRHGSENPDDRLQIRNLLGVRYVLSGWESRKADKIYVLLKLIESDSGRLIWADRFDGNFEAVFEFYDHVSRSVVAQIAPRVQQAEIARIGRKVPESLSAYDWFLKGLDKVYRLDRDQFALAKDLFQTARKLDAKYAPPYAYEALWHAICVGQGWSENPDGDRQCSIEFARKAVELDPFDASALSILGHLRSLLYREHAAAYALFNDALRINPNSAMAWTRSSPTCSYVGDWKEGMRRAELGLRLSPLDRHVFVTYTAMALASYTGQDYDVAIQHGEEARSRNPGYTANLRLLCASYAATNQLELGRIRAQELLKYEPNFQVEQFCRKYAYAETGRRESLAQHLIQVGLPT